MRLCSKCVHSHSKGCMYQIDKGISEDYLSKKGQHRGCYEEVSKIPVEVLLERRSKVIKQE